MHSSEAIKKTNMAYSRRSKIDKSGAKIHVAESMFSLPPLFYVFVGQTNNYLYQYVHKKYNSVKISRLDQRMVLNAL